MTSAHESQASNARLLLFYQSEELSETATSPIATSLRRSNTSASADSVESVDSVVRGLSGDGNEEEDDLVTDDAAECRETLSNAKVTLSCSGRPREHLRVLDERVVDGMPPLQAPLPAWHRVLFSLALRPNEGVTCPPRPLGSCYKDAWDRSHVRMPCSPASLYPAASDSGHVVRWSLIERALLGLVARQSPRPLATSYDLERAIRSYNSHLDELWNFDGLHAFFNEELPREETAQFFAQQLPAMVRLALNLPNLVTCPVPLLTRGGAARRVTLSQQQCASLLANAFFCTFPRRNLPARRGQPRFPSINFNTLYRATSQSDGGRRHHKLRCLLHYFHRVTHQGS